ncbi:MAG: hypothetical protein ACHQ2Z_16780 [Elusimicrobiota bacterium]
MDNSPLDRGLSLTLAWGPAGARRVGSLPLGPLLRVGLGLTLCAVCFAAGRWRGALEVLAERSAGREAVATRAPKAAAIAEPRPGAAASGRPVGEPEDIITPLNVRDPSALVMGPGSVDSVSRALKALPPPPVPGAEPETDAPPSSPPARIFPRPNAKVQPPNRF